MDPVLKEIYTLVVPAAPYVIAAYVVLWLGVFGYLFALAGRLGRVEEQLAIVEETVSRKG
jgi:CcmD family protein